MARSRKVLTAGAVAVAALALIGAGASATFNTSTEGSQTITAGTVGVSVWAPGSTLCPDAAKKCKSITLAPVGPVASTFETPATTVYMTNNSDIPVSYKTISMSETHPAGPNSDALRDQMNVCITGWVPSATTETVPFWVEGNGPLTAAIALGVTKNGVVVQPGETAWFKVTFYAGKDSADCGTVYSAGRTTQTAWYAFLDGDYRTPASLTNAAMGGVITPKLTFSFTG